jgi:exopolyphosphatase/guanosine-5'-triphosphate,3'-diphosphate pyrophosphatase
LPGLKEDRRAVIAGGLSILYTLAAHFGIDALLPARGALRQGVIFDLEERLQAAGHEEAQHDIRDASVRELQRRFMVDAQQAARVRALADALYASVQPQAGHDARRELEWAATLHEVGMMISHHDHHRHSAYVLDHVDAAGFSQSQLRRVGELVLGQRGGLRKLDDALADETFASQVLCLRLAVILCHARGEVDADGVALRRDGRTTTLDFPPGWFEAHPRTLHLLREEAAAWARSSVLALDLGTLR